MGKAISSLGVALLVKAYVEKTTDATYDAEKVYYEKKTINAVDYYVVSNDTTLDNLYEIVASTTASAINAWVQPVCLTDVPDIGGEYENIETTTLCDSQRTYIQGILDAGESLDFTANYIHSVFIAIKSYIEGSELPCKIVFGGIGGDQGSVSFNGYVSARINGFGVNEVVPMTISVAIASELTYA